MLWEETWQLPAMDSASGKTYVYAGGKMAVVRESTQNASGGWDQAFEYFATDHLGTVRFSYKVDASGTLIASSTHDYEPFGLEIGPIETSDNTHRFTGHERDAETGNDYMHFRYYGASMGRFAKPDSNFDGAANNPQGWNLYSYVHGNPVNLNDPTGHMYSIAGRNPHQLNHGMMIDGIETWYSGFSGVYDPNDPGRIAETERNQRAGTQVTAVSGGTVTTSAYDANGNLQARVTVSASVNDEAQSDSKYYPWIQTTGNRSFSHASDSIILWTVLGAPGDPLPHSAVSVSIDGKINWVSFGGGFTGGTYQDFLNHYHADYVIATVAPATRAQVSDAEATLERLNSANLSYNYSRANCSEAAGFLLGAVYGRVELIKNPGWSTTPYSLWIGVNFLIGGTNYYWSPTR